MSEALERTPSLPTALVIIDVQTAMMDTSGPDPAPHKRNEVLNNIVALVESARNSGAKVIYIRHAHEKFEPMMPGNPGFEIQAEIAPQPGETVIDKRACDSFCKTDLEDVLRDAGISHIVTCGMQTDYCVDKGSRSALHKGFNVTLASDAHTTWDTDILTAEQIIAHTNKTLPQLPGPGTDIWAKPSAEIRFAALGA